MMTTPGADSSQTERPRKRVVVAHDSGMAFEATASGHKIMLDASARHGGQGRGASPMDMLLVGLGGCTGMDVISLLRKMRQDVTAYRVELEAEQREEHPRVFTTIKVIHIVRGRELDQRSVARAIQLSAERYCPASTMLGAMAEVEHTFQIEDEA